MNMSVSSSAASLWMRRWELMADGIYGILRPVRVRVRARALLRRNLDTDDMERDPRGGGWAKEPKAQRERDGISESAQNSESERRRLSP